MKALAPPRVLLVAITGLLIAAVMVWALGGTPTAISVAGLVLQSFGLCVVAWGLYQTRCLFDHPTLLEALRNWRDGIAAACRPSQPREAIPRGAATATGIATASAAGVRPGKTLEERVTALESNIDEIREDIKRREEEVTAVRGEVKQERQEREREIKRVSAQLEETAVGGLHLEALGLVWILAGAVATSLPDEIAAGIAWLSAG